MKIRGWFNCFTVIAKNIGTLCKYYQRRLWKWICIVTPFDLLLKKSQTSILSLDNKNLKWGKYHYEFFFLFSNIRWTQLLAPQEIIISKISLKYITIHIHNFVHSRVIMNMKLSSHGFLFHRNINKFLLIIHHNENKYISDVQQNIIELHKLVKWL